MSKPTIAGKAPAALELATGEHWWCACGLSSNQPICDGSHKGTEFQPLNFRLTAPEKVFLCMCKQTANPPRCDGAHTKL